MATSKLQRLTGDLLDKRLPEYRIRENYRPDWLVSSDYKKLELDFYLEEIKIGIEVQGEQHYRYVEFFHHNHDGFRERLRLDKEKNELCRGLGIRLIEIFTEMDVELFIREIEGKKNTPPSHKPTIQSFNYEKLSASFILRENENYDLYYNKTKRSEVISFIRKAQRLYIDGKKEEIRLFKFNNLNKDEILSVWEFFVSIC
jgi:hypothetical protein